jgi:hypothetical protein
VGRSRRPGYLPVRGIDPSLNGFGDALHGFWHPSMTATASGIVGGSQKYKFTISMKWAGGVGGPVFDPAVAPDRPLAPGPGSPLRALGTTLPTARGGEAAGAPADH